MDEKTSNLEVLQKRISELERERDELQLDIEQLCMQQSGMSRKADVLSKVQERRITSLKLELEASKQKLEECMMKNGLLQEELTEVRKIKEAELETTKQKFQTAVENAVVERDKAILQVETSQTKEKELSEKVKQLEDRMEQLASELHKQNKVVDYFWEIRSREGELQQGQGGDEKTIILLGEPQSNWMYGDRRSELEGLYGQVKEQEIVMDVLKEKYQASIDLVSTLERELEELATSKKIAEDQHLHMMKSLNQQTTNGNINEFPERRNFHGDVSEENYNGSRYASEKDSELQEALALALQEKVTALLLLSQQEQRRILGEETISAQKTQIAELQKQLLQVTADKANVLMELANLWGELQRMSEQYSILPGVQTSLTDSHTANQDDQPFSPTWNKSVRNITPRLLGNMASQSYNERTVSAKWSWSRDSSLRESLRERASNSSGSWMSKFWSKDVSSPSFRIQGDYGMARLQAENDALWNIMSMLKQLYGSVTQLHQRIVEVARAPQGGSNFSRISLLDAVIKEGQQLRIAFDGLDSGNEFLMRGIDHITTRDAEKTGLKDLAAPFGGALLDSILLAAEICKSCLITDAAFFGNFPITKDLYIANL